MAHSHNKRRMAHALGHEPSYCLFSCESILAVFENREQEQKLYKMYFLNQVNRNGRAPCWTIGRHKTSFLISFALPPRDGQTMRRLVRALLSVCFVEAMLLALGVQQHGEKIFFYGKTLHSLRWQPETNECVSATDSVKMRLRILTSCKNRVKSSYKQKEGTKRGRDKETKRLRE